MSLNTKSILKSSESSPIHNEFIADQPLPGQRFLLVITFNTENLTFPFEIYILYNVIEVYIIIGKCT